MFRNVEVPRNESGFSLLEVAISILLMGLVLVGILKGMQTAVMTGNQSNVRATAVSLATAQIETVKSGGYNPAINGIADYTVAAPSGFRFDTIDAGAPGNVVQTHIYGISWDVNNSVPVTSSDSGIQKVTIIVASNLQLNSKGAYKQLITISDFKVRP
jgi:Tfp pilus assembly protein PilV